MARKKSSAPETRTPRARAAARSAQPAAAGNAPTQHLSTARIDGDAQKSQSTRQRLIRAGLEVFGESGFAAATTRQIAARARVNLAAIPYYFGTKEDFFAACIQSVLAFGQERFLQLRTQTQAALEDPNITRAGTLELLERFLLAIFDLIADDAIRPYAPLVLREHIMPGQAFESLYKRFFQPQHTLVTSLVAQLCGLPPESPEAILRAHALFGQIFGYLSGRNLLMRRLQRTGPQQLSEPEIQMLRGILSGNIRAIFAPPPSQPRMADPGTMPHNRPRKGAKAK